MANRIITLSSNIPHQLSNENLVVYSDISMQSKYNANAASTTQANLPQIQDYYDVLVTENYEILSTNVQENGQKKPYTDGIQFLTSSRYFNDKSQYVNKVNLSRFQIEKNINVKAVQESLHNIFTWIPGERILNPEFGNTLYRYLYGGITDYNSEQIMAEIRHCISELEPRVQLVEVQHIANVDDTENNTVHLEIIYIIPTLSNKQFNYTYIYHKNSY